VHEGKKGERMAVWDREKKITIENMALLCKECYEKHGDTIR